MSRSKPNSNKATKRSVDGNETTPQASTAKPASKKPKLPPYRLDMIIASYASSSTILHNDARGSEATLIDAARARMAMTLDALERIINTAERGNREMDES